MRWTLILCGLLNILLPIQAAEIIFDFESGDLQGWRIVDGSFGTLISDRAVEHHAAVPYTKQGKYFLSTLESKDGTHPDDTFEGIVESPVIILADARVTLRVGGGQGDNVYVAACLLDGKPIAQARGRNTQTMYDHTWDLAAYVGQSIFFRVVDHASGAWGHITLDHLVCQGTIDTAATEKHFAARREFFLQNVNEVFDTQSVLAAIAELEQRFSTYPAAAMRLAVAQASPEHPQQSLALAARSALVTHNPLLTHHPILFTTRKQYRPDHHNTATLFQTGEINAARYDTEGALKVLSLPAGTVKTIFDPGPGATIRDPEVDFDGQNIVFSMRRGIKDGYHIYTIKSDGRNLRQLTATPGTSNIDPLWLPDGEIVFAATREPKYCMCNRHIMCNLYRMQGDGANIHQIGKSTLFEGHPTLMPDGRILYDRWEYVDRNFGDAQGLWVCNPDGTGHALYWGNNTTSPGGVIDARTLSQTHLAIAVLASCHDRPWGALGLIDRSKGVDGAAPILRTWPAAFQSKIKVKGQDFDSTVGLKVKYEDPFPLDDTHFLCAKKTGKGEEMGIYYLDLHGNEILVHAEAPGCYDPMPLRPRAKPPIHPTRRNFRHPNAPGYFYLQNVYIGTDMQGVAPGSIKALRIVESPEKRNFSAQGWHGQGEQAPAMNWHNFENKRILGTVPVEADGSAYFEVPGNTFVFFQALDAHGMMVQSMRSGAYVQPGETYGCVGCHENRVGEIPPTTTRPLAMQRPPNTLHGWYGAPRLFSFQQEIQPIFDKHCVSCHDYGKKAGQKLNLCGDRDFIFNTSYVDLWALNAITCVGGGPATIQPPFSWGSHASQLIKTLRAGHQDLKLSEEEMARLITWVDLNAPYYPVYECAYSQNPGGRSPLTWGEINQLKKLTGQPIHHAHGHRQRAMLNFARPQFSRVLDSLDRQSEQYARALKIIAQAAPRLEATPRADMPGFIPNATELARERLYQKRLQQEQTIYQAISAGRKLYDPELERSKDK